MKDEFDSWMDEMTTDLIERLNNLPPYNSDHMQFGCACGKCECPEELSELKDRWNRSR